MRTPVESVVSTTSNTAGALLLKIPVRKHTKTSFQKLELTVGPFATNDEATAWELEFAKGFIDTTNFNKTDEVEARTMVGRHSFALTNKRQVELSSGPPGTNLLTPDKHLIVHQGKVDSPCNIVRTIPDIDARVVTPEEASRNLDHYITLHRQKIS
jgi:hypothetical protein